MDQALNFLVKDEEGRVLLTSMVFCLFARGVYKEELLADCLKSLGYEAMAGQLPELSRRVQRLRWQTRPATGFNPANVSIPKRFTEVTTWKGKVDSEFLAGLKDAYARRILKLAQNEGQ